MEEKTINANGKRKSLLSYVIGLVVGCILINYLGARLASALGLPIYLDTIGTILAAALGGYLPGIIVGFVTNLVNSLPDPGMAYYSSMNVLIAFAAVILYRNGFFKKLWKLIVPIAVFAVLGGALGSVITWLLSGMEFGDGGPAPLCAKLYAAGFSPFLAQLTSDYILDLLDKLIVCLVVFILLKVLPSRFQDSCRLYAWQQAPLSEEALAKVRSRQSRAMSLRSKILLLLGLATLLIVAVACSVSYIQYRQTTIDEHIKLGKNIANLEARIIDPEKVDSFISDGDNAPDYKNTESALYNILYSTEDIEYVYVYRILENGCQVVFDLDTAELEGASPGEIIEFDESFQPYLDDLRAGKHIEPIISNDTYGWLLTVYEPIYNSKGECECYAAVDISMGLLTQNTIQFLARVVALSLGFILLILVVGIWLAEYNIILPVNSIAYAASRFAYTSDSDRSGSVESLQRLDIHTGDEIENLYHALAKTTQDTMEYISYVQHQSATISKMQNGLILVLADMVESRDQCTGDHVRKTAAYANVILQELRKEGKFKDILTDSYIEDVVHSAPLHDVGKIQVSDVLLNKPGKLTDEEFKQMQTHTSAGGEIISHAIALVSEAGYLAEAKNLATYHHERWDGKGYPTGLAGDAIPLSARIMAVADVFDALVSRRSYKPGFPFEKAMDIIREESGTHFDPDVAQAFLNAEDEVRRIEEEFNRQYEAKAEESDKEKTEEKAEA